MSDLKPCPFCGSEDIYETYSQEWKDGTKNPEIFCNSCKVIFAIEDDSPFVNCEEDYKYRKAKTKDAWNRRRKTSKYKDTDELLKRLNACKYPVGKATMRQATYNAAISDACRSVDATPSADVEPVVRCKDCHFFESDHLETVNGVPFITAHNICTRWGRGCQTAEDGFCFMGIRRQGARMDGGL